MANVRTCSCCGGIGHDARNCPSKQENDSRDKVVWYKVENLSDKQADKMTDAVIKSKQKIAPDAQATFVKADKKSLPERISKALGVKRD